MFVSNKKLYIVAIILVILAIAGSAFYLLSQDKSQAPTEQEPTVQQEEQSAPLQETPIQELPTLSEEDLARLWLDSERCPKQKFFTIPTNFADFRGDFYDTDIFIEVIFTHDAMCEDIERIAILLDAKIIGFNRTFNIYAFELSTPTAEEAKIKIYQLNDPKIDHVFKFGDDSMLDFFGFRAYNALVFPVTVETPSLPDISLLSQEELTRLWANGERCPEKDFYVSVKEVIGSPVKTYLNIVRISFTGDETCEDIERIAILLDAKIIAFINFKPSYSFYNFQLPTETLEALDKTIIKVKKLEHPKIKSVRTIDLPNFEE